MFYMLTQNNSFGEFNVNDKLCHRMIIEADSEVEVRSIAEELGCYWDGVAKGIDCPCCGDRWDGHTEAVDLDEFCKGYEVTAYVSTGIDSAFERWHNLYDGYDIVKSPAVENNRFCGPFVTGKIKFRNLEEYVQFLADEYPGTTPDARIFYKDGTVKEFECKRTLRS